MADDNKIEVQIVLDNGSIVKGFVKLEQAAEKSSKKMESSFGEILGAGAAIGAGIAVATVAIDKFGQAASAALDQVFKGERLKLIETQFQNLSKEAGIASDQLAGRFKDSLGGLADDSDAFAVLNEGIVRLGERANSLPEIFELSRKATNLFGGDAIANFQKIEEAIANGNTRALKSLGLRIDEKKALDEYAKSIGVTSDLLSDAGKQQAILNAVLEKGEARFKAVSIENGTATESLQRLKVTLNNLGDELAIRTANAFGGVFKTIIDGASRAAVELTDKINPDSLDAVERSLGRINSRLAEIKANSLESTLRGEIELLDIQKNKLTEKANLLKFTNQQNSDLAEMEAAQNANARATEAAAKSGNGSVNEQARQELALQNQDKFNEDLIARENARDQILFQNKIAQAEAEKNFELAAQYQKEQQEAIHQQNLADIIINNKNQVGISNADVNAAIEAENARSAAVLANIEKQKTEKEKAEQKQRLQNYAGVAGQIASLQDSSSSELAAIGKAAAITQATIDGYLAVQNALAVVPYPFNFAAAALVGVAAAANVAKIASTGGGAAGGGGNAFSPATTGGGGIGAGVTAPAVPATPIAEAEPQKIGPRIEVNIAGDVLDSDETGLRIVDLINKAFDQSGAVVTGSV